MAIASHDHDHDRDIDHDVDSTATSERGGLLEEIPISNSSTTNLKSRRHNIILQRLREFDLDDDDDDIKHRWKVLVVPGLCLFFGFIFGISAGVLLAGGGSAFASQNTGNNNSGSGSGDYPICKIPMPPGPRLRKFFLFPPSPLSTLFPPLLALH